MTCADLDSVAADQLTATDILMIFLHCEESAQRQQQQLLLLQLHATTNTTTKIYYKLPRLIPISKNNQVENHNNDNQ